jgi:hypothetical protein
MTCNHFGLSDLLDNSELRSRPDRLRRLQEPGSTDAGSWPQHGGILAVHGDRPKDVLHLGPSPELIDEVRFAPHIPAPASLAVNDYPIVGIGRDRSHDSLADTLLSNAGLLTCRS